MIEWISAHERMPEDGQVILARHSQLPYLVGIFRKKISGETKDGGIDTCYENIFIEYSFADQLCTNWDNDLNKNLGDLDYIYHVPVHIRYWIPLEYLSAGSC